MLERRRCSPLYIFESAVKLLLPILIYLWATFSNAAAESDISIAELAQNKTAVVSILLTAFAVIAVLVLMMWLRWKNTWISAKDNVLLYESGVFAKKKKSIPFSKINTIDMGRNWVQRIFGTCRLKIDTGALNSSGNEAEMDLVFTLADAEQFRAYILNRAAEDEDQLRKVAQSPLKVSADTKWTIKAKFNDFFLYGLTSSGIWKLFLLAIAFVTFIAELSTTALDALMEFLFPRVESVWNTVSSHSILIIILLCLVVFAGLMVLSSLFNILTATIKFYNFRVAREIDSIIVRYGLVSLKNYTMPVRNIHAVVVRQNLFQQMVGLCSVEMVSIGYGDENTENSLLFPIIKKNKLPWLLETLLPEYKNKAELHGTDKRSIRFHIIRPVFWCALMFATAIFFLNFIFESLTLSLVIAGLLLVMILVGGILNYKNAAIGWDDNVIVVQAGGMNKHTHYIRTDAVQSVRSVSGIFQRRHGLVNYAIDFHAPLVRSIAVVSHLDKKYAEPVAKAVEKVM
ncbi:MAG: hypothetical protein E7559_09955 [Ruminococcaceae bacterium]|nr:hypothetical protein [Oscillospiraceae bacterium]